MFRIKSTLKCVSLLLVICGFVFVIGCGDSQEREKMAQFLMEYGKVVDEYSTADNGHKAEIAQKVDSYKAKWGAMKVRMEDELTPQDLNALDKQYQEITKKYENLAGKS